MAGLDGGLLGRSTGSWRWLLSLLRSLAVIRSYPGLTPWAIFFRRFAAAHGNRL